MKNICKDEKGCSVNYFNKCRVLVVGLLALRRSLRFFIEELIDSQQIRMSRNGKRRVILFNNSKKRRKTSQAQCCEPQPQSYENDLTQDTIDEEHMRLYTSIQNDVFQVLVMLLGCFELKYFNGWTPSLSIENQLLIVLMKLKLNLRDTDLAHRFCVSRTTISNIFNTLLNALHEMLYVGVVDTCFPSQLKCKGSMPKSSAEFSSARD
ncbi:uncharacterized protein LOC144618001 [Crassostrea virginica]